MGDVFEAADLLERQRAAGRPYLEFLRRDALSAGVYRLEAGKPDLQQPHTEDEVYYVLDGEGVVEIDGERTPVRPGSVVYIARHVRHRFVDYPAGLTLLVVFAPASGSNG
jgi:mannose-6-phosphate isomerase-like protein (cupin superfamily)